jgi:hypothetical protein
MSLHTVTFDFVVYDQDYIDFDVDPALNKEEKERAAFLAIRDQFPDVSNIQIVGIKELVN